MNGNHYRVLDEFLEGFPKQQPKTYKAVYPRRIVPPNGYLNPKYFSATLFSEMRVWVDPQMRMLPHITGYVHCLLQMNYRVPTYFVRSEFAQAVAQTEPPEDFKFSEIKWPLPAMLFVLPTDFVMKYFGYMVPFIGVARSDKGDYPKMLKDIPDCEIPVSVLEPIQSEVDRINIVYPVYSNKELPVDYTGSYPLSMNVNEMDNAPSVDATYMEEDAMTRIFGNFDMRTPSSDLPAEGQQEKDFNSKVQAFAVKLMLALTAKPGFIVHGTLARAEKRKRGRITKLELWNPNLIGWEYQAKRVGLPEKPTDANLKGAVMDLPVVTHASPRMHWRRGHMRNQPYGPKPWNDTTPKRLTWIEPVLINADET